LKYKEQFDLSLLHQVMYKEPKFTLQRFWAKVKFVKPLPDFQEGDPCFFILTTGRTGTMTIARLLNLAPEAYVYHEPDLVLFPLGKLAYQSENQYKDYIKEVFLAARRILFKHSLCCGRGYGDAGNYNAFLGPIIADALPCSKFIHLIRLPTAFVRSAMRRKWYQDATRYDRWRIEPRENTKEAEKWDEWSALEKNIWLWKETNRYIRQFGEGISEERFLRVRSENLFRNDKDTINTIFDFLGLTLPKPGKIKKIIEKKLNKQLAGDFQKPEEWDEDMKEKLLNIAGEEMKSLGYDTNILK